MEQKLTFKYDCDADILVIHKRPPYAEQESEDIADGVIANFNKPCDIGFSYTAIAFAKITAVKHCKGLS